ncbi:MAG TPA: radical SAM protein [Polyangiaceae bacterium]|nr:radical SAM protein [Polyangiaceae bacterium]
MKSIEIICYTSKLCNLRCKYCYELPLLADKRRMSLASIEKMFRNFKGFFDEITEPLSVSFQWHGGEPMLIEPAFYWDVFELQKRVFDGASYPITNGVQSNFTQLDDERIRLMRDGFDLVGVSLDLFTGLRVNLANVCQEQRARTNLRRALEGGVRPGGITVLSKLNMNRIDEVYAFWRDLGFNFRVLPVEPGLYEAGQDFEIRADEVLHALKRLTDLWLAETPPIVIEPIHTLMRSVLETAHHPDQPRPRYDPVSWQSVVLVDTDGHVYGYNERLDQAFSSGNVFYQPFAEIAAGAPYRRNAERAQQRMDDVCTGCEYFGQHCSGRMVADGGVTALERNAEGGLDCIVTRGLFAHIEQRLREGNVLLADKMALNPDYVAAQSSPTRG